MNRRAFIQGLLSGAAAVMAPAKVYSFLTNNPLAFDGYEYRREAYPLLVTRSPAFLTFNGMLKELYPENLIDESWVKELPAAYKELRG